MFSWNFQLFIDTKYNDSSFFSVFNFDNNRSFFIVFVDI